MRLRAAALSAIALHLVRKISHCLRNQPQKDRLATPAAGLESRVCWPWADYAVQQEQKAKRFYVSGTVQGVGYRYFVERSARYLKLAGYVRNLRDGRVEVYAIGPSAALASLRENLERGPQGSAVAGVSEEPAEIDPGFADAFSIEYDD
jgi:acylphosphatase